MANSPKLAWSPQQAAFIDWAKNGSGSCVLEAVAGAGKTTTVLGAVEVMGGQTAIMAYNKAIADEIKAKLVERGIDWRRAQAGTVHSFGFGAYRKQFPQVEVREHKVADIVEEIAANNEYVAPHQAMIRQLVSHAKQRAIGIVDCVDNTQAWMDIIDHFDLLDDENAQRQVRDIVAAAKAALNLSNQMTKVIDFDDMVYLPIFYKVKCWQYDNIFVDEAQDTNMIRRLLVKKLVKRGGRVIAVGDSCQAIYAFSGADSDSLNLIAKEFNAIRMPLTVTYRCPKTVVAFARQWVDHIEAHESAPEGSISSETFEEFVQRADLDTKSAVLCRNTAPLVSAALKLIRSRIACRIEGREIGQGLVKLATRWKSAKMINALQGRLETYCDQEVKKAQAKKKESRAQAVIDQVDTLYVIMDRCREEGKHNVSDVVAYVDGLFSDRESGVLTLSTIHRSKGREWHRVFWLDRANTCPSKWAKQNWEKTAERNLCYVAATRAKAELIDLSAPIPAVKYVAEIEKKAA